MEISLDNLKRVIEAALLMSREPQTAEQMSKLFTEEENVAPIDIINVCKQIAEDFQDHGVELVEVASGYRFQVCQDLSPWISRTMAEKPQRYSRAVLETLALVAYRQPITRAEIEDIRGVAVSTQIMRTLEEREWVRVIGHRDVPGRPGLYATTKQFLDDFNLKSLGELPTLAELRDLDQIESDLEQQNIERTEIQQEINENETQQMENAMMAEIPTDTPHEIPQEVPNEIPVDLPEEEPELPIDFPDKPPEETPDEVPVELPEEIHE